MSLLGNLPQSSIASSVCRIDGVSVEAELVAYSPSSAPSTFRSYERLHRRSFSITDVKFPHCTEALGSESCDDNQETVSSRSASWDSITRCAMDEDLSVLHVPAEGKQVGGLREIIDNSEADSSAVSDTQALHTVPEDTLSSLNGLASNAIGKLSGMSKDRRFPPLISSMCSSPDSTHVYLRRFKGDGRFVLQEVKVPCQNMLRASRTNGRLTLELVNCDKFEESSCSPLSEFEWKTPNVPTEERISEVGGFIKDRTENSCSGEITGTIMRDAACNGEEKLENLVWYVNGNPTTGGAVISSLYSTKTPSEERNSTSTFNAKATEFSVMEASLDMSSNLPPPYGLRNAIVPRKAVTSSTDRRSVREQYDPGIVSPLAVF